MDKVIFDTNAYRYLVKGKKFSQVDKLIQKLKAKEQKNNIETLISPIVAKELLAHVADKKDASYDICLNAIKALYLHSSIGKTYNMVASPELLISKAFFDKTIPANEETNKAIGQMLYHIATNPTEKVFKKLRQNLQANKDHVINGENSFATQMKQFVSVIDPDAKGWQIFPSDEKKRKKVLAYIRSENCSFEIALAFLFISYQLLVFTGDLELVPNEELREKAKSLISVFPEPIALHKQVLENLVNSEFNLFNESRTNFVWDIQLMFNVGNHQIDGSKLYFVTDDKAIIRSAIKENAKYTILNYEEYLDYLKK
jgi:hypothetical protein